MSRILRAKRKLAICIVLILSFVIIVTTPFWYIAVTLWIMAALYVINIKTTVYDSGIMRILHTRNEIIKIDTLVIGDTCSRKIISQYKKGNTICIQHHNRGLEASYQIFMHLESLLENGGRLVIVNDSKVNQERFSIYDIPFLNKITQKELNIERLAAKTKNPLFVTPLTSIAIFLRIKKSNYNVTQCPRKDLTDFCNKRNIELIYLNK